MRVPYSDRSVHPSLRPCVRLEGNGQVHLTVPVSAIFTKLAPTVYLDMIF